MNRKSTRTKYPVLQQICQLIPAHLVDRLAREHGVDKRARTFSPFSHIVALLYAQLAHALSLHGVCDGLAQHAAKLWTIRRATAPSKNALSHANRHRSAAMAQALFWQVFDHLLRCNPRFGQRSRLHMPRRFKRAVRAVDSTTIALVANCIDWARHRRRKAAAKLHLSLNLQTFLPSFAVVDTAASVDCRAAAAVCANMQAGEIVVFDKAYLDFKLLYGLTERGVFWVTRPKKNLALRCVKRLQKRAVGAILSDRIMKCAGATGADAYPECVREVRALVEIDGEIREMTFLTNNMDWAASSICDLYRSRWAIEVFFKEIKQTLQLCDFLGHNKNAIAWQIWIALLLYVLLRFLGFAHGWARGFKRLVCVLRACAWDAATIASILRCCGTAGVAPPMAAAPQCAYFPGFAPTFVTSDYCRGTAHGA